MSENCDQSCGSCSEDCKDRTQEKVDFSQQPHHMSSIKKVICVVSGKGGVGKSFVTSMMGVTMNQMGYNTAILDADITGPSIPKAFGIKGKAKANEFGMLPRRSKNGIDIMSVNLLLENATDPVVWRGPIIANTVKQFWTDVIWAGIDYMFIDMPPGTGDVPLTVFQSLPVDGIIIVTSPQELVSMIVAKAVKMANMMNVPIIGLVENMSYFECPDTGKKHKIFGESHIEEVAEEYGLKVLAKIPIDPEISAACDRGEIEDYPMKPLEAVGKTLKQLEEEGMTKIAVASEGQLITEHFGHCINFNIYDVEDHKIVQSESIDNPGHKPGFLPNFLNDMGVKVIISGGMGQGAVEIYNEKGIEVIVGAKGDAKAAAESYLKGQLKTTGSVCDHDHDHDH